MPEPECEFKDLCFDAHMMLAEKTMLYKDSFCIVAGIEDGQDSCIMYLLVKGYLNSPQFKKERLNEIGRAQSAGFREGQKYPDPKKYAKLPEDGKNPYPLWKPPRGGDQLRDNDMHTAFKEGQQNPDKKQYAKITDLVGLTLNGSENLAEVKVALGIKEACDERE